MMQIRVLPLLLAMFSIPSFAAAKRPLEIRVLHLAMFEVGELRGDTPGEAQLWIERNGLSRVIEVPGAYSPLYCNDRGECLAIVGVGPAHTTASMMAIGLDSNVDLSRAYIIMGGLSGGNPNVLAANSVIWAKWAVDSDLGHQIDPREMPTSFKYGQFRMGCSTPWCDDETGWTFGSEVYQLDESVVDRAFRLTKNVALADNSAARAYRSLYPLAPQTPSVVQCDTISGGSYFHGRLMSQWADWWVSQWTKGRGRYCSAANEETAFMTAMHRLASAGKVDARRALILRSIGHYDQQHEGQSAIESLQSNGGGIVLSTENLYRVGNALTQDILQNWDSWKNLPKR